MQRHEAEGATVDMLPAVAIEGDKRKPFLSGTGIKGAFRAQSERILRTVLGQEDLEERPLDLVTALYGAKAEKTDAALRRDNPRYLQPGRGAVTFDDCRLDRGLSPEEWRKLLTLSADDEGERLTGFRKAAKDTAWKAFSPAALVAIDRWTGGAAEKFLFSRLEPDLGSITLSTIIDPERIAPPPDFWKKFRPPNRRAARQEPRNETQTCRRASCPRMLSSCGPRAVHADAPGLRAWTHTPRLRGQSWARRPRSVHGDLPRLLEPLHHDLDADRMSGETGANLRDITEGAGQKRMLGRTTKVLHRPSSSAPPISPTRRR